MLIISNSMFLGKPKGKVMKFMAVVFILILSTLALPTSTRAAVTFHQIFKDLGITDTEFSSSSECVETDVFFDIGGNGVIHQPPGPPSSGSEVSFQISKFDTCTFTQFLYAICLAFPTASEFQVSNNLSSAKMNLTNVICSDFVSNTTFNVSVNLTWMATTNNSTQQSGHTRYQYPGLIVDVHFEGVSRSAQASGIVTDGITNFTPQPSVYGSITSIKSGELDMTKW